MYSPGNNGLATDCTVLVNTEIVNVNSPIHSAGSKHSAGVRGPTRVRHLVLELEYEERRGAPLPPDLDGHLSPAGEEDVSDEIVPVERPHRSAVSLETAQTTK